MISLLALAPQPTSLGPIRGIGPLGLEGKASSEGQGVFVQTISNIVGFLTVIAIIWFVFQFILGAMSWITAGGDAKAVEGAKAKLTNAVIGIVIVIAAMVIMSAIGALLGIDIFDLGKFITTLTPGNK